MQLPVMKNYINGEWQASQSGKLGYAWCPATGKKIARVQYSNAGAKEAFWERRTTPPLTRARYLFRVKEALEESFDDHCCGAGKGRF